MGMLTEGQILNAQRKAMKEAGRNDELLLSGGRAHQRAA